MSLTIQLRNRANGTVLSSIDDIAFDPTWKPRISRPASFTLTVPLDDARVIAGQLVTGVRSLYVEEDGFPLFHGIVWDIARTGNENQATALITAYDPMIRWQTRWCRDAGGSIVDLDLLTAASGGAILKALVDNSIAVDGELSMTTGGVFDLSAPPSYDLSALLTDWPQSIGDLATLIINSGAVDVIVSPIDNAGGPEIGELSVVDHAGSDLSGSVAFDYAAADSLYGSGSGFTIREITHAETMDTLCNKLWYYLGPRLSPTRWRGNITEDAPGVTVDTTDSRGEYGIYHDIRVYDDRDTENSERLLYTRLWNMEQGLRMRPRESVKFTPIRGNSVARPPFDFGLGDIITVNVDPAALGIGFGGALQRVFGWTVKWDSNGTRETTDIITTSGG